MSNKKVKFVLIFLVAGVMFSAGSVLSFVWFSGGDIDDEFDFEAEEINPLEALRPKPSYDDLQSIMLFEEERMYSLKKTPEVDVELVQIPQIEMLCFKDVPGIKDPVEKINSYSNQLREFISVHFQGVHPDDVINPEGRERIKLELLKGMNEVLKINLDTDSDLIYNLVIEGWMYA